MKYVVVACVALAATVAGAEPGELFPEVKGGGRKPPGGTTRSERPVDPHPALARPTPVQIGTSTQLSRKLVTEFGAKHKLRLVEFQTEHFMVFSDCSAADNAHIGKTLESGYAAIARALGILPADTPFVGKLPVVITAQRASLAALAEKDGVQLGEGAIGYFWAGAEGNPAHLAMALPAMPEGEEKAQERAAIRKAFGGAIRRELVPAVLSRHRTTRPLPAWLERGLAASMAEETRPSEGAREAVRARGSVSIKAMLPAGEVPAEMTVVCQTLVEFLLARDGKAFAEAVRSMKDGISAPTALHRAYKLDELGLDDAWKASLAAPAAAGGHENQRSSS